MDDVAIVDVLYLSPHADDAVFSCGGQIFERSRAGERVAVLTIACGDPPDQGPETSFLRRQEDEAAVRSLGAMHSFLDLPDAIHRRDSRTGSLLYGSRESLFGPIQPDDPALPAARLAERIRSKWGFGILVAPLGAGGHVDHALTRSAAESCSGELLYYEDYPYVESTSALQSVLSPEEDWLGEPFPLSPEALRAKLEAVRFYASQLAGRARAVFELRLIEYCRLRGGEPVWRRRSSSRGRPRPEAGEPGSS